MRLRSRLVTGGVEHGSFRSSGAAKKAAALMVANLPIQWRERTIDESEELLWYGSRLEGQYYPQWALFFFPIEIWETLEYDSAADFNRNAIQAAEQDGDDEDDSDREA